MGYVKCLRGIGSGAEYPPDTIMNLCPEDNRPVEIVIDIERLKTEKPDLEWYHPERPNMWRFGALLPLDVDTPADRKHITTLAEGDTPTFDYSDFPRAKEFDLRLEIKDEGGLVPGSSQNPTQSFKDRGMAMVVSMAQKLDLEQLAIPTQGNAGDALTEYAVAAGLDAAVVMPESTPIPVLGKVAGYEKLYDTIDLAVAEGTIGDAGNLMSEKYLEEGYFNVATFKEPGWRIDGKKTMGLELAEPDEPGGEWGVPDVIIYPTGGGTGILGMWKAFEELEALGLIGSERPRIVAVQSSQTAPLARAFEKHAPDTDPVPAGETIATGLNVPSGVGHFRVLEILYQSDGHAIAVSEERIASTLREMWYSEGWWLCPEGAACIAAIESLIETEVITEGDHVVAFNTASLEKYLPAIRSLLA
jgi:threonine synthase